ncbi:MAG: hypothetical protein ACM3ZC_10440 [Bacteroidota bacterium]
MSRGAFIGGGVVNLVYQLSREEVLKVCGTCEHFESFSSCCKAIPGERKSLPEQKKCRKWDEFYGGPCLYRQSS